MVRFSFLSKRRGTTLAGVFSVALGCALLLCGAGSAPVENFLPQGAMQGDLNAGGHDLTNAATVYATNFVLSGQPVTPLATLSASGVTAGYVPTADGRGGVSFAAPSSSSGGAAWGGITGTLSSQTDLQSALNGKQG